MLAHKVRRLSLNLPVYSFLCLSLLFYFVCFQLFSTPPPPPPLSTLPSRINQHTPSSSSPSPSNSLFSNSLYNAADSPPPLPLRIRSVTSPVLGTPTGGVSPPPLPPRQYPLSPTSTTDSHPDNIINASNAIIEWGVSIYRIVCTLSVYSRSSQCLQY